LTEPNFNIFPRGISKVAAATIIGDLESLTMNYYLQYSIVTSNMQNRQLARNSFPSGRKEFNYKISIDQSGSNLGPLKRNRLRFLFSFME
jgi:hypothetical protein